MRASINPAKQLISKSPSSDEMRFLLLMIRTMGARGIRDAQASSAAMQFFGGSYRQPLLLIQTLMLDLLRAARFNIIIGPQCCPRVTTDEWQLLTAIELAAHNPKRAQMLLTDLTGNRECQGVIATIEAITQSFASLGRPISGYNQPLG